MSFIKSNLIAYFVIPLIIPFLIVGPFFSDLIVSLSSLIFLIYVFKNKIFFFFKKKPLIIFFIFCIYCILISIFVAEDTFLSFESSLFFFRIGIFSCVIWFLIEQNKKILTYFYFILVSSFSLLVLDGYIQYFSGYNIFGLPIMGTRVSSFFGDELIMGSYLSRLFPLLFALFLIKKKYKFELFYIFILFILTDVLIFITGERVAFFYLNLSSIFIIILVKKYQKLRLLTFVISLIIISILSLSNNKIKDRMIDQTIDSIGIAENSSKKFIFSPAHDSLIRTAYKMFQEKPIFGQGPKMFRVLCKYEKYSVGSQPCLTHPHNFYIQLLAETGIVGFTFLFISFIYVIYCSIKQTKSIIFNQKRYLTDYQVCLLSCLLIIVWPLSPNGNFFNNWLAICCSIPIGFYLQSIYGKNKNSIS